MASWLQTLIHRGMDRWSKWWMLLTLSLVCHRIGRNGSVKLFCQGLTCCEVMWRAAGKQICNWQSGIAKFETCNLVSQINDRSEQAGLQIWILINNSIWLSIKCWCSALGPRYHDDKLMCTPSFLLFAYNENHYSNSTTWSQKQQLWFQSMSLQLTCQLNDTIRTEIHIRQMLNQILQYGQQNVGFKFVVNDENSLLHFASVALSHIKGSYDSEKNTIQIVPLECCWSGHCSRNLFPSLVPETTTVIVVDVFAVYTWQLNDDIRTERYNRQMCNQIFQYGHQSIAFKFVGNDENSLLHFASIALSHIEGSDDEYETNSIVPLECCWSRYSC
jgi:hypothetical protein